MPRRGIWLMISLLASLNLSACAGFTGRPQGPIIAFDRLLASRDIQVAEGNLKALGFDPGPVDGRFTAQTAEAVRQYQRRYGLTANGLLDRATRDALIPGLDRALEDKEE